MQDRKVAVVTGATSGIGFAAAHGLASQGFHVIATGRNPERITEKGAELIADIPDALVDWVTADFSAMREVARAASNITAISGQVDVLVNNAGLLIDKRIVTEDGLETMFAVNHLAGFLLTTRLLPALRRSARGHIIGVSSIGHTMISDIEWSDLQMERNFSHLKAYFQSKLGNVLFTRELARRLSNENIIASAVHPGMVASRFPLTGGEHTIATYKAAEESGEALTSEQGADTIVWLANNPDAALPSGGYFTERKRVLPSEAAQNPSSAERLWEMSEQLLNNISEAA